MKKLPLYLLRCTLFLLTLIVSQLFATQFLTAADENTDPKLSGELRYFYQNPQQNSTAMNGFDVSRAYVTLKKKLTADANLRITLDVGRVSSTSGAQQLYDYLKYAYVDLPIAIPKEVPMSLTLKFGLQHNMWIDWADKIWDHAYIMKQFSDNEGLMSSADFGFGATGKVTISFLPELEYHLTVLNGTGYKSTETNNAKDVGLRMNSDIYKDQSVGTVTLGSYINLKDSLDGSTSTNYKQAGWLVTFKNKTFGTIYSEGLLGENSTKSSVNGLSVGGFLNIPGDFVLGLNGIEILGRVDTYDPDTSISNNDKKKTLIGIAYQYSNDVKFAYDLQTSQTGDGSITKIAYVHMMVTF